MERAADLLGRVVRRLKRPEAPIAWLASSWLRIVGKTIATHAHPVRCQAGCLEISADGKVWQHQLQGMARDLRDQINQAWGGPLVRELKFTMTTAKSSSGPSNSSDSGQRRAPRSVRYELDNDHTPFIRHRK
ncbi:MAG TPA: DUF721 domain-containing protein [Candidatus Acidoferrum sp.]|nr:DUF721 domain-containing protein [Candidatus Acidoferrum sp.]